MRLAFEHVTHTYQAGSPFQATAIKDICLTVSSGEFVALIGHTGSGKSTIANLLARFYDPVGGKVTLDDGTVLEINDMYAFCEYVENRW